MPLQESLTSLLLSELAYKQADEVAAAATELRAGLPEGLFTFERIQWSQDHVEHRLGPEDNAVCMLCGAGACFHATWYGVGFTFQMVPTGQGGVEDWLLGGDWNVTAQPPTGQHM